jgi:hypothetical protein
MAGTKKKKPRKPQKKKHPPNEPSPGTNVLSWEVSSEQCSGVRVERILPKPAGVQPPHPPRQRQGSIRSARLRSATG